jgi:hypothetical protein
LPSGCFDVIVLINKNPPIVTESDKEESIDDKIIIMSILDSLMQLIAIRSGSLWFNLLFQISSSARKRFQANYQRLGRKKVFQLTNDAEFLVHDLLSCRPPFSIYILLFNFSAMSQ